MKKFFRALFIFILVIILSFAGFLAYITITDYKPNEITTVYNNEDHEVLDDSLVLDLAIWNIGYAGLSQQLDFFYDGGENVYPEESIIKENINGIKKELKQFKNTDFILLQEVDVNSTRTYNQNLFDTISNIFPDYYKFYGKNYDVPFVPIPVSKPMGKVNSGLMTISKYQAEEVTRHSFNGNYAWPKGLFLLDRCFLVSRFKLKNKKELLVINTHNSAYDDGTLKEKQMKQLKDFLLKEFAKGNYIIVGGDWNQCPPDFKPEFEKDIMDNKVRKDISKDYLDGWIWLYENDIPTNRRVTTAYKQGESLTTVIDFYLISPNIKPMALKNINMGFKYSDHQAVKLKVQLQ